MVCVMTSAPLSNGVTHAFSKAVQIGGVFEAVTEEYDLKQDYDGKHIAKGKGVHREVESEGSRRQKSGLTDRNRI